ncbi:MAG: uroporphyrinogen decarboxylase [candidate division Zixibacteria bacterium]|nr:uroporphyrinogen decarboxylase [candidate division Zixibacteria bacterium]
MPEHDFIKAAFGQPHDRTPIWVMRQAGRYLPAYRAVREKVSFAELCRNPHLMAEVTRQPIDTFGFDAAILFSDILLPLEPMGIKVSYEEGGPTLHPAVRDPKDVLALNAYDPGDKMAHVLEGIREIKRRLNDVVPLIGFCGAPFTLATYLVEGGGSASFTEIKKFVYNHPREAETLLGKLAEISGQYLKRQIEAGADAVQLFDTWGGILSPEFYRRFSLPYIKTVFDICKTRGVPRILYLNFTRPYLADLAELDCEVVSVDWRTDLTEAMRILDGKAIQGNLDPHLLFGPGELVRAEALRILETTAKKDGFIFNLGHGILPQTPTENVRILVETVHSFKRFA